MRIEISWPSYNQYKCGRPWIGKIIAWETAKKPEMRWGAWIGNAEDGGVLEIDVEPGDVIRYGQVCGARRREQHWALVLPTGEKKKITAAEALRAFRDKDGQEKSSGLEKFTTEELQAELARRENIVI